MKGVFFVLSRLCIWYFFVFQMNNLNVRLSMQLHLIVNSFHISHKSLIKSCTVCTYTLSSTQLLTVFSHHSKFWLFTLKLPTFSFFLTAYIYDTVPSFRRSNLMKIRITKCHELKTKVALKRFARNFLLSLPWRPSSIAKSSMAFAKLKRKMSYMIFLTVEEKTIWKPVLLFITAWVNHLIKAYLTQPVLTC